MPKVTKPERGRLDVFLFFYPSPENKKTKKDLTNSKTVRQ